MRTTFGDAATRVPAVDRDPAPATVPSKAAGAGTLRGSFLGRGDCWRPECRGGNLLVFTTAIVAACHGRTYGWTAFRGRPWPVPTAWLRLLDARELGQVLDETWFEGRAA